MIRNVRQLIRGCLVVGLACFSILASGCTSMKEYMSSPQYDADAGRFEHPRGYRNDKGFFEVMGLAGKFLTRPDDPAELNGMPLISPDLDALRQPDEPSVTWIGHATLLFQHDGKNILTDPVFSNRASPFSFTGPKRVVSAALKPEQLPDLDLVIISHAHYDHLDMPGLRQLAALQPDVRVVVPLGLGRYASDAGFRDVSELDWWQADQDEAGPLVTATPVRHWASRGLFDRNKTLWAGFMIRFADGYQFYFAGDTGYGGDFVETRERLGAPDFAAIPIGAYEPREFMKESHCNPEEAVQIFQDLRAGQAIGIHWGTFKLTLEPLNEPPQRLKAALSDAGIALDRFRALTHGESWKLQ